MIENFLGFRIKGRCFEHETDQKFFSECEDKRTKKISPIEVWQDAVREKMV